MRDRSFSILIVFIALAIAGCALVPLLPVRLAPSLTLPSVTVSFSMQGTSARTIEQEVTSRIESALARVGGVKSIDSKSSKGSGRVSVSLDRHADMDKVRFEISTLVRQIWGDLPEGVSYPSISLRQVDKEGARPFITLTLNAPSNPSEILSYGEEYLKPVLSAINGVAKVELSGARPMEWKLHYDIDRLSSVGITPDAVRKAIGEHYDSEFLGLARTEGGVAGGDDGWLRLSMKSAGASGGFVPGRIPVMSGAGSSLTLDKLTDVSHEESAPTSYFRINGLNSIYVNITAEDDANQLKVADGIKTALAEFAKTMPAGYMTDIVFDATDEIRSELDKIYFRSGLTVLILLLFVALVSLNVRYVLMISIGLAINLAVAAVFYYVSRIEIQLYSLAGITISLNLIIDNLIVMADHYTRRRDRGAFTSILAATLTTVGALSVVFFMDEKTRLSLQDFVAVVIINLAVSLAVALFLVPALVEKLGISRQRAGRRFRSVRRRVSLSLSRFYGRIVGLALRCRVILIVAVVLGFGLPVFMLPERIEGDGWLAGKYNATFGSTTYRSKVKPWVDNILGGSLRLFVEKVYDGSYWNRDKDEPVLVISATLPNGATLEQMNVIVGKMEAYLAGVAGIRQFQTSIYSPYRASISVFFEKEHRYDAFPYKLKSEVVSKALTLGGGSWSVYGLDDMGFSNDVREDAGSYRVRMTGYNYDDLYDWACILRDTLLSHRRIKEVTISSEFSYFKDDYSEFHLAVDRDRLAKTGVTASQLFAAIEPTFGRGIVGGRVVSGKGAEQIRLYSRQGEIYDIFTLMHQPFKVGGKVFKLSDFGRIERLQTPQSVVKKNQEYVLCLQYEYIGSEKQGNRVLERDLEKINSAMPVGYRAVSEKNEWQRKDDSADYRLLLLVIGIIFFTTSILFNSLLRPLAIIFIIPVSFIGVFLIFYLLRLNFDQGGFASFILLAGITVNAAIYVLNEYDMLRARFPHVSRRRLYVKAVRVKIVTVLLTVISTVLGFVPFIIGSSKESFWYPLAMGTMGGLVMSLIALLLVFPVFVLPRMRGAGRPAARSLLEEGADGAERGEH